MMEKRYSDNDERLPKTRNDFIFAEGYGTEAEKFEFQRNAINEACSAFNSIKSAKAFLDETIENEVIFNRGDEVLIEKLDKNYEELKQEGKKKDEKFNKFKSTASGLGMLLFIVAFGLGYLSYWLFTSKVLPLFKIAESNSINSDQVQLILLFSYALIFFFMALGGSILFIVLACRKNKVSVEEYCGMLDKARSDVIEKLDKDFLEYKEQNANMLARFDAVINKTSEFEQKLEKLYTTTIGRYLPPIDVETMLRVQTIMEEGLATSYVDALSKAKDQILKEKQRKEDIAREEARHREQKEFQEEMLASQHRTESYAKEAADSAREQASIASSQLDEMRAEARANSEFRQSQLKQGEKALKQSERAMQESRDRYDEFKRNNY